MRSLIAATMESDREGGEGPSSSTGKKMEGETETETETSAGSNGPAAREMVVSPETERAIRRLLRRMFKTLDFFSFQQNKMK